MQDVFTAVAVRLQNSWFRIRDEESAQGLVEYALIIVVVSLGTIAALTFLRDNIRGLFSRAGSSTPERRRLATTIPFVLPAANNAAGSTNGPDVSTRATDSGPNRHPRPSGLTQTVEARVNPGGATP